MVYLRKKKIPARDDIVIAKITKITNLGIEVSLPEYNDTTGYVSHSDSSRRRKGVNNKINVGNEMLMIVININVEKDVVYIDLSKRGLKETEEELFNNSMKTYMDLYNRFRYIYMKLNNYENIQMINQDELYEFLNATLFEIQDEFENDAIMEMLYDIDKNTQVLGAIDFEKIQWNLEQIKTIMDNYIRLKNTKKKESISFMIRLKSLSIYGCNDIKYALDFKEFPCYPEITENFNVEINYVSASKYLVLIDQKEIKELGQTETHNAKQLLLDEIGRRTTEKNIMFDDSCPVSA